MGKSLLWICKEVVLMTLLKLLRGRKAILTLVISMHIEKWCMLWGFSQFYTILRSFEYCFFCCFKSHYKQVGIIYWKFSLTTNNWLMFECTLVTQVLFSCMTARFCVAVLSISHPNCWLIFFFSPLSFVLKPCRMTPWNLINASIDFTFKCEINCNGLQHHPSKSTGI